MTGVNGNKTRHHFITSSKEEMIEEIHLNPTTTTTSTILSSHNTQCSKIHKKVPIFFREITLQNIKSKNHCFYLKIKNLKSIILKQFSCSPNCIDFFSDFRALCNIISSAKKSSQNGKKYFKFNKKSSTGSTSTSSSKNSSSTNSTSTNSSADSFTTRMRKFVSNGNQNNSNAPVSRRKKKSSADSEVSNNSNTTARSVSRSSSEPALNQQPQEAFLKQAPINPMLVGSMSSLLNNKKPTKKKKSFFRYVLSFLITHPTFMIFFCHIIVDLSCTLITLFFFQKKE